VLKSKLYPVYFCAMACGVELALAAHLLLEPKATKVICVTSCVYTYDSKVLAQFLKKSLVHEQVMFEAGVGIVIFIFGGPLRHVWITVAGVSLTRFALVSTPPAMTALAVHNPLAIGIKHN